VTAKNRPIHSQLKVRVHPKANRNEITGFADGLLQVKVAAPPVKGKANSELIEFLSEALGIRKSSLTILKGLTGHNKVIEIEGLSQEEVIQRLPT
jgi:uncharacterized protein